MELSVMDKRNWIEINKEALKANVDTLKKLANRGKIMAIVKDNCYGMGTITIKYLASLGIDFMAVSTLEEAIQIRQMPYLGNILILGYVDPKHYDDIIKYNLIMNCYHKDVYEQIKAYNHAIRLHLKINSGMNRLGFKASEFDLIRDIFANRKISVEGIYSHLLAADEANEEARNMTIHQINTFNDLLQRLKKQAINYGITHFFNTAALEHYNHLQQYDYVRPGIGLVGGNNFRNVLSFKAKVALVQEVKAHEPIGYGAQMSLDHDAMIAVIAAGYGDGLHRNLAHTDFKIMVNNTPVPLVGRICMDYLFVDISAINNVKINDVVEIYGNDNTIFTAADKLNTLANELLVHLNHRVERKLV